MLGLRPHYFWKLTPAEFSDLLVAHRARANAKGLRRAWELNLLTRIHVTEEGQESVSMANIFKSMPGTYPDDVEGLNASPALTDAQRAERERRRNLPRVNRPKGR